MCLWCCWKHLDEQDFNGFDKIWIQNVKDIDF
jgi:hypothetical protein